MVVWLHRDHLRADNGALAAFPDAPVVFVFDEEFISEKRFAFHRLFFIYESVMDVFTERGGVCSVRRGKVPEQVVTFAREHNATRVVTTATLGSRFARYQADINEAVPVVAVSVPSLVAYDAKDVPKRFSVWWRQVEGEALADESRP